MCYACCHCGRCKDDMKPIGACLACGYENEPGVRKCVKCGARIVPPPGQSLVAASEEVETVSSNA